MFTVHSANPKVRAAAERMLQYLGEPNPYSLDPQPMTVNDVVALLKIRFGLRRLSISARLH